MSNLSRITEFAPSSSKGIYFNTRVEDVINLFIFQRFSQHGINKYDYVSTNPVNFVEPVSAMPLSNLPPLPDWARNPIVIEATAAVTAPFLVEAAPFLVGIGILIGAAIIPPAAPSTMVAIPPEGAMSQGTSLLFSGTALADFESQQAGYANAQAQALVQGQALGQAVSQVLAQGQAQAQSKTAEECPTKEEGRLVKQRTCLPCIPPLGTIAYRTDYPPSPPHNGIPTPHSHQYKMNQVPINTPPPAKECLCWWVSTLKDPILGVHLPAIAPAAGGGVAP